MEMELLGENYQIQGNRIFGAQAELEIRSCVSELSEEIFNNYHTFLQK
jgi:hypothetical protein